MKPQSCFPVFARYTTLSVLGTLGISCYILADTFFISKGLGANGLTALNLAIPLYSFTSSVGLMLGVGGATKFSILKSQDRPTDASRIYTATLYLAALFSAVFVLLGLFFSTPLALLLGADGAVLDMTVIYLRWLLFFTPIFILNDILLYFVRNDGGPQLAMIAMIIGSFANIALDYIFIFPLGMGIFGAIFATGLSPAISIVMMLPHWTRRKNTFHFIKTKPDAAAVGPPLALGFPTLVSQVSSGIVMITFNTILLTLAGNTGVAAYSIIANISLVTAAIYNGIAQGIQPLISSFYGQRNRGQIQTVLRYAVITVLLLSCAIYGLLFLFAQPTAAVFNSENNPELQQIAASGLRLYFLSSVFVGFNTVLAILFTSIEKPLPAHILSLLRGLILILPAVLALSALWGMTGVWLAYPAAELITAVIGYLIYRRYFQLLPGRP